MCRSWRHSWRGGQRGSGSYGRSGRRRVRRGRSRGMCRSWRGGQRGSGSYGRRGRYRGSRGNCRCRGDGRRQGYRGCRGRRRRVAIGDPARAQGVQPFLKLTNGDRESDTVHWPPAGSRFNFRRVDANYLSFPVDKGPAAVAGVNRSVGLQKVNPRLGSLRRDNTPGYRQGITDPVGKRKAEREHLVAHPHAVGVPDPDRMEPLGSPKVNEGDVGCRVFLQHPSFIGLAVRQSNLHYVRISYNMLIGYDQAVRADNKTRSASMSGA